MREIKEYINNDFKAIDIHEKVSVVQDFFIDLNYSHFPVVEKGIYIGCIASNDVETFEHEHHLSHYRYALEGFYVRTNMIWIDILEVFARNKTNIVPVLDDENKYAGYYEINDINKFFYETPFLKELGGIIVIEKPIVDYSMSQIAQIVESNNGKLLGVFVSDASLDKVQITVKITLGAMNDIIQTFRRYNYEIISEHNEDNYLINLKERSEYLDKYLNM